MSGADPAGTTNAAAGNADAAAGTTDTAPGNANAAAGTTDVAAASTEGDKLQWDPEAPASGGDVLIALRFADRAGRKAIADELTGTGVHTGQEIVLAKLLHLGSLPVAKLAKVLDVEVPTATKTTQRMEAAGLVRRVKNDRDARQVAIELTDHGRELAQTVQHLHTRAGDRALQNISPEHRRLLRNLLWTITTNIEDPLT